MKKTKVGFTNWCVPILIFSSLVWGEMSFQEKSNQIEIKADILQLYFSGRAYYQGR